MRIMGRKIPTATIGIYLTVIVVTIVMLCPSHGCCRHR